MFDNILSTHTTTVDGTQRVRNCTFFLFWLSLQPAEAATLLPFWVKVYVDPNRKPFRRRYVSESRLQRWQIAKKRQYVLFVFSVYLYSYRVGGRKGAMRESGSSVHSTS